MKTLFCLGLHKTGSTSLQQFLLANQLDLARAGVLYPAVHPQGVARFMAQALGRWTPKRQTPRLNEYMGHNALAHRLICEADPDQRFPPGHAPMPEGDIVFSQITDMARQMRAKTQIFCSEELAKASTIAPDIPKRFATRLKIKQAGLFAIIRRPDEALSSWQSQMLKFRSPFAALTETGLSPWLGTVHLDYRAALAPWLEQFPKAEHHFLPYDEVRRNGGAVAVFRKAFAQDLPEPLTEIRDSNTSLPYALIDIARLAIQTLPLEQAVALRRYLGQAAQRLSLPANRDVDLLGTAARFELMAQFQDCHTWLGKISGCRPFFADLDDMIRPRAFDARSASAEILPALLSDSKEHLSDPDLLTFLDRLYRMGP